MSFLRRLLGGSSREQPAEPPTTADAVADESAYERELLLEESRRLDNDLIQRQLRHADKSWTPPTQGGTRRADDTADDE
jgi:hypothetical protein